MRFSDVPSTSIKLMFFPFSLEDKVPRECLRIIESKSKVRNSQNKAVVAKVSSNSSTPGISPDVSALTTEVSKLKNMMKTRLIDKQKAQAPAPVKAVEQSCVTCGGAHSYRNYPATDGNNYRDNIQEYGYSKNLKKIVKNGQRRTRERKSVQEPEAKSTPGISPDVAALTTEVSELKNMMKTMLIDKQKAQAPAPVKAVEQSCVTCGGAHSYRNCPTTDGNVYRDNIQEYVSQAAAANFNQGNTNSRPPMVANQIRPPGFPLIQNNQNRFNQNQGNNFNQNRGTNFNQNRGNNFYQGQVYQPPTSQPPVYQAQPYQAPAQQMQGVSKTDFENYVKANDAVLRNMQNQGQGLQNQMTNLTEMLSKFVNSNTASSSNSGSLPSNTVTNPKEDLKGITTRSGIAYQGPTIPTSSPKVVERRTEVTKDTIFPNNNGITKDVQPPVVPVENQNPVSEPVVAPVSAPMPNQKPSIPYPSRRNDEKHRENADEQKEKFYKIFKDMSFEISFVDALTLMPKFASTLKALIGNKEKLSEMARTPLNEHCSAVILNKLPEKLGDPGRFLIPCKFPGMDECLALADLGASINLMPFSFPADFVVVDFEPDPRVPLILGRCFLKTNRALIDVYEGELTLRVDNEASTYNLDQTSRYSVNYNDMTANRIDVVELACEEYSQEVLGFSYVIASGNPVDKDLPPHLEYAFLEDNNKLPVIIAKDLSANEKTALIKVLKSRKQAIAWKLFDIKEVEKPLDAGSIYPISDSPWVRPVHCMPKKGGITVVTNDENELVPNRLVTGWRKICEGMKLDGFYSQDTFKYNRTKKIRKPPHFTFPYETFLSYRRMPFGLYNAPGTFQRCMMVIFHDMIEKTMEVFMDDFSVFGNSFSTCLTNLEKMLKRCEDTNLALNWEKSHFMVKECIVLGHKISKKGIEVDKAKIDVIAKLPHPTTVKGIRSFLGHACFYRRFIKDFSKISRPMTHLLEKNTPFIFSEECIQAFQTLKKKLTKAPILIARNWDQPFELMCDASDYAIGAVLGQQIEKHFRPIHYASKTITEAESNYTTTEKEMLAVVYAFEKF
ncbi:reverse transcriptase domain-containing protein [Tanacetum coccineum]